MIEDYREMTEEEKQRYSDNRKLYSGSKDPIWNINTCQDIGWEEMNNKRLMRVIWE
jgi:hypothetical protein